MHRLLLWACLAATGLPATGLAAVPDYFPLAIGNVWIYRITGVGATPESPVWTIEVKSAETRNGLTYHRVTGYRDPYLLRSGEEGTVYSWDEKEQREVVWYRFGAGVGEDYPTSVPYCCGRARISSKTATVEVPVGSFDSALELRYPGVFQVGIEGEWFLPWIGLLKRTVNTGGPSFRSGELIYARLGGVTVVSAPQAAFSLTLDRAVYVLPREDRVAPPVMTARLSLLHTQPEPLRLVFPSGQTFDFVIRNSKGDEVYRWSEGKAFTLALRNETVSGEKNEVVAVRLITKENSLLPPGEYTAEGWLTTIGTPVYKASVGFRVVEVR
ncbi:MAG: BsuPI-related putative proteinase inhibitor [Bryobacteraceae bacterium]